MSRKITIDFVNTFVGDPIDVFHTIYSGTTINTITTLVVSGYNGISYDIIVDDLYSDHYIYLKVTSTQCDTALIYTVLVDIIPTATPTPTPTSTVDITCFQFLPQDTSYLTSQIGKSVNGYYYGYFTGYEETGLITTSKHLIKLNDDLTIDNAFYVGVGFDEILYGGSSILEQPDGKIIVGGTFTLYQGVSANRIIRLNTNGTRDNTFVIGDGFNGLTQQLSIDSNGSIIVTGLFTEYNGTTGSAVTNISRLLSNGTLDSTFIIGSGFDNTTTGSLINSDNSMILSGYFNNYKGAPCGGGITKLTSTGDVDVTFNVGAGISPHDNISGSSSYLTRITGETSFYIAGYFTTYKGTTVGYITKINSLGDIDLSFTNTVGFNRECYSIYTVWGNKLFVEGAFTEYDGVLANGMIILNSDGSVYYAPGSTYYNTPIVVGNKLYGALTGNCLQLLNTYVQPTPTPTSTVVPPTPTPTPTSVPPTPTPTPTATDVPPTPTPTSCNVNISMQLRYDLSSPTLACLASQTTYYVDNANYAIAAQINTLNDCTNPAPAGYYSNGSIVRYWSGVGLNTPVGC